MVCFTWKGGKGENFCSTSDHVYRLTSEKWVSANELKIGDNLSGFGVLETASPGVEKEACSFVFDSVASGMSNRDVIQLCSVDDVRWTDNKMKHLDKLVNQLIDCNREILPE